MRTAPAAFRRVSIRQFFGVMTAALGFATACSTPRPDPRPAPSTAAELIAASLRALRAPEASQAFEIEMDGRQLRGNPTQAYRWTDTVPIAIPTRLRYLVDPRGARAMYELRSPAPGDIWFHYLTRYDTTGAWQIDLMRWRVGTDILRNPAASARANLPPIERLLPHVALQQALRGDSLRLLPNAAGVYYVDRAGARVAIAIDPATRYPASITVGPSRLDLGDYRDVEGTMVPFHRVQLANGQPVTDQRVVAVRLRPDLGEERFAIPAGYSDPPPAGAPRAVRLGDGVYRLDALPGGYHAMFVVRDTDVAVLEAPLAAQTSEAALHVIAATAPGKPVTQVFITHHHADHVGGLAPYIARGAELVAAAGIEEGIRRQLPDSLARRARFAGVAGRRAFGGGATRIEAIPVPNTHVEGNVAYYLPAARVLFQGDLFYIPERGPVPPAFPVTAALARVVRGCGLDAETVVGVHGRTGSWSEVETSLRLAGMEADRSAVTCGATR